MAADNFGFFLLLSAVALKQISATDAYQDAFDSFVAGADTPSMAAPAASADGATSGPPVRCLSGWRRHGRGCYRSLQGEPRQFQESRQACYEIDPSADLSIPRTADDMRFIEGLLPKASLMVPFFLGGTNEPTDGEFRWHDDSLVTLGPWAWAEGEPSGQVDQNCLLLIKQTNRKPGETQFALGDAPCTTHWSDVVCQMPFPQLALPVTDNFGDSHIDDRPAIGARGCDYPGVVKHAGSCYLYQDIYLSQSEADKLCRNKGFLLASVQSQQENDIIQHLISDVAWLGGRLEGGQWRWPDGAPLVYTNWAAAGRYFYRQPDGRGRQLCLNMLSSVRSGWQGEQQAAGDGRWADNDCNVRWPSVCEAPDAALGTSSEIPDTP